MTMTYFIDINRMGKSQAAWPRIWLSSTVNEIQLKSLIKKTSSNASMCLPSFDAVLKPLNFFPFLFLPLLRKSLQKAEKARLLGFPGRRVGALVARFHRHPALSATLPISTRWNASRQQRAKCSQRKYSHPQPEHETTQDSE